MYVYLSFYYLEGRQRGAAVQKNKTEEDVYGTPEKTV